MLTPGWTADPASQDPDTAAGPEPAADDAVAEFHGATRLTPAAYHRTVRPLRRPPRDQPRNAGTLESWHAPALEPVQVLAFLARWRAPRPTFAERAPVEIYASVRRDDQTWSHAHHDQSNGRLHRIADGDTAFPASCARPHALATADAVLHLTAIRARLGRATPPQRAYRIALLETASALCELRQAAAEAGLIATPITDFFDARVELVLGLDGFHELYIASLALRTEASA
jgi:hypothetical protein